MQDVVVVLPTQVVSDICERRAGCLGHAVVDDYDIVFAVGFRHDRRTPLP